MLPPYVAPNELIASAWGNAIVDTFDRTTQRIVSATGIALSGTFAGEATVCTLNVPNYGVPGTITIAGMLFVSKAPAGDRHVARFRLDGSQQIVVPMLGLAQQSAYFSKQFNVTAGAHTLTTSLQRDVGTGTAQVFADGTTNYLTATFQAAP